MNDPLKSIRDFQAELRRAADHLTARHRIEAKLAWDVAVCMSQWFFPDDWGQLEADGGEGQP